MYGLAMRAASTTAEAVSSNDLWVVGSGVYGTQTVPLVFSGYWEGGLSLSSAKAMGVNNKGEIVGVQIDNTGNPNLGFYWDGVTYWSYTTFPSFYPLAGINNNSMAAGYDGNVGAYWSPTGGLGHTGLLSPSDPSSVVNGLNDNGLLVGTSGGKAFLFDTGVSQIYDLSAYLLPGSPFSQLTAASDINNTNEFVGVGLVDGVEHGFVGQILVPEPGTSVMLAAIAVAIGFLFARKRLFHSPL